MKHRDEHVMMLALIAECYAKIAAMQASNYERDRHGYAQAYGEESFWEQARILAEIAARAAGGDDGPLETKN